MLVLEGLVGHHRTIQLQLFGIPYFSVTTLTLTTVFCFDATNSPGPDGDGYDYYSQSMGGRIRGFNGSASKA